MIVFVFESHIIYPAHFLLLRLKLTLDYLLDPHDAYKNSVSPLYSLLVN